MSVALVKYVGSKRWLVDKYGERLPMPTSGQPVAVPFVGAGSVAAEYRRRGCVVFASDLNPRIVDAHIAMRDHVEDVIGRLTGWVIAWEDALARVSEAERNAEGRAFFERVRDRVDEGLMVDRAAALLFIVRAGFNGLLRENKKGEITTAYGKPEDSRDLIGAEELRGYARAIQGVEFRHEDFAVTCARARAGWAVYLDPPFEQTFSGYCGDDWDAYQETLPGLRVNHRKRLAAMVEYLDAIHVRWALSDSDTPATRSLYRQWRIDVLSRKGTVNSDGDGRGDVPELFVTSGRSL